MPSNFYNEIRLAIPVIIEYIFPLIKDGVEASSDVIKRSEYYSNYSFGTTLWDYLNNSITELAKDPSNPIIYRKYEYFLQFQIGDIIINYPNRVDPISLIPRGAKAAKKIVDVTQHILPGVESYIRGTIILAIDADSEFGLRSVFLGILEKNDKSKRKYRWQEKFPVFTISSELEKQLITETEKEIEPQVLLIEDTEGASFIDRSNDYLFLDNSERDQPSDESEK